MKKDIKLVEDVIGMQKEMNALSVDTINDLAPKLEESEPQTKISLKEIAKSEGIPYIEPLRKFQAFGTLPEKWKKKRDYDWEYVKGVFENEASKGEPIKFTFSKWPGDPDCMWQVPANKPCYVPRMIAQMLSGEKDPDTGIQSMQYHEFSHIERPPQNWMKDDFTTQFTVTGTHSRGKFRPIGAFS